MKYLIVLAIILSSCNNTKNAYLDTNAEVFTPSIKKPYTTDIKYYSYAIRYWQSIPNSYANQFPKELLKTNKYEFIFIPRFMQGNPSLALKIEFPNTKLANDFFENHSKDSTLISFNSKTKYSNSSYCNPVSFNLQSKYQLPEKCKINLFRSPLCSGKSNENLGGQMSGIALDSENKTVICWNKIY